MEQINHKRLSNFRDISSLEIATALQKVDPNIHAPTEQQRAIIESTIFAPTLVIAGAGSGKTETMATRVLWLVANGYAKPSDILGLTFTNKAAGELHLRIRKRLRQLQKTPLLTSQQWREIGDISAQVFTYHAYAGKILREDGIKLGIDAGAEPMGEAATWQLARKVLANSENFSNISGKSLDSLIDELINLADSMAEHNLSERYLRSFSEEVISQLEGVIPSRNNKIAGEVIEFGEVTEARIELLKVVDEFNAAKINQGSLTFNDQMNFAAQLVTCEEALSRPIITRERGKYAFVVLDEFQDTSPVQVEFLSALFGENHPVCAVGDPNQAIYEWRGAGAETLAEFPRRFSLSPNDVPIYELTTSWRNDKNILDLANLTILEIAQARLNRGIESSNSRIKVSELTPSHNAGSGSLLMGRYLTDVDEARAIAQVFYEQWHLSRSSDDPKVRKRSFAILVRKKSLIPLIEEALHERDLPVEIVGFDGLIHLPEIADLIALLRILVLPDSGSSFMRLATGPYLNLGASDLYGLGRFLNTQKKAQRPTLSKVLTEKLADDEVDGSDSEDFFSGSVIEALENLTERDSKHFSEMGFSRLLKFRDDLKHLRRNLYGSITDSIIEVVRYLHLDTELELRDGGGRGRLHLNKFLDEAAKFSRTGGSLFDFLSWIKIAESEEGGLKPAAAEVDSSVIQILTVHSAKGLEWDIVSIPGLVEKKFPDAGKKTPQWTKHIGVIPSQMRRDSSLFNHFEWPAEKTSANVRKALEDFDEYWKSRRELEEYRLAYVAFTRAKSLLLLTSALFYGSSETPSEESRFSHFARAIILQSPENTIIFEVGEGEHSNPATDNPDKATWPLKREINSIRKEQSIALTRAGELSENEIKVLTSKAGSSELDLLVLDAIALLNDKKSQSTYLEVVMPLRLSVSALISLSTNKEAFALNVRRPLPIEIDPFAKRGTVFHTWLENHFQRAQLITDEELELIERVPDEDFKLTELKEKWLASEYANKEPFLVEMPFDLSFNGVVLRGRIDAIYRNGDEYEVVDWKTGRSKSGREAELVAIQLATYRLAFSRLHKVPLSKISAKFFYVGEGLTVQPNKLMDEDQLHSILTGN